MTKPRLVNQLLAILEDPKQFVLGSGWYSCPAATHDKMIEMLKGTDGRELKPDPSKRPAKKASR